MLFVSFLTCLCLNVLLQVNHLLKLHFRNQKSNSCIKKNLTVEGLGAGRTSGACVCRQFHRRPLMLPYNRKWKEMSFFPVLQRNHLNIHSYQTLIMFLLLPLCFDEADNNRNLHLFAFFYYTKAGRGVQK